ncbi:heat shock protein Hsp-16.1/Hsp-16.11-like [Lacerta agilis]|uniref:heat shock protein Hsp-16.1/Hsp-16.11-like n=1 Tax=Lacerta agilis TaxID=80427 RepID=UPI001419F164|nr:heat shock protein Hsp-16.1/Hsp-16.11-like [Lacerta agilis]
MASYSRYLLRMLPLRRWPLHSFGPVWLSGPQSAGEALWPAAGQSLVDRVAADVERQIVEMETMSRAFFQASPLQKFLREASPEESVARDGEAGGKFHFSVDVAGFAPEDVAVRLDGRKLTVTAKRLHENTSEEGGCVRERHEVRRETLLPADVDLQAVTCSLASDGRLCIEAPRLAAAKAIPIDVKAADQQAPGTSTEKEPEKPQDA